MKNSELLDIYSDYLISAFGQTTATGLAGLLGGSMIMTATDGTRTNLSRMFYSSGSIDGWTPNGTVECSGDTLSWSNANGYQGFVLERR